MGISKLQNCVVAFVGGGIMAEGMIRALLRTGEVSSDQIIASDPRVERRDVLQTRHGINATADNLTAVAEADVVVLAIKPQAMAAVMAELQGRLRPEALVFSIVAGMPVATMVRGLSHEAVVRSMPNTPAQIGEGMTVWTASPAVTAHQRGQAQAILATMGKELYVSDEDKLDMATAVSGTGPTYVFLLMEALVDAAVHLGFARTDAQELVIQTVLGSVRFAQQSDLHLAQLRNMVTSPGGTSAEAIYQLEKGGMRTILSKAIWAAYQKSRVLGQRAQDLPAAPLHVDGES